LIRDLFGKARKFHKRYMVFCRHSSSGSDNPYIDGRMCNLIIRISSKFGLPPCSVVLEYKSPISGRNRSHSIQVSNSATLSPSSLTLLYRSCKAKSRRLSILSIVCTTIKYYRCFSKFSKALTYQDQ
jgi:hypothetical protein